LACIARKLGLLTVPGFRSYFHAGIMAGSAPSKAAVDYVDDFVKDNKVAVFSKSYCPVSSE